jgi:hypothetical protein
MNNEELYQKLNRVVLYVGALIASLVCGVTSLIVSEMEMFLIGLLLWIWAIVLSSFAFAIQFNGYNRRYWEIFGVSFGPDGMRGESA